MKHSITMNMTMDPNILDIVAGVLFISIVIGLSYISVLAAIIGGIITVVSYLGANALFYGGPLCSK